MTGRSLLSEPADIDVDLVLFKGYFQILESCFRTTHRFLKDLLPLSDTGLECGLKLWVLFNLREHPRLKGLLVSSELHGEGSIIHILSRFRRVYGVSPRYLTFLKFP